MGAYSRASETMSTETHCLAEHPARLVRLGRLVHLVYFPSIPGGRRRIDWILDRVYVHTHSTTEVRANGYGEACPVCLRKRAAGQPARVPLSVERVRALGPLNHLLPFISSPSYAHTPTHILTRTYSQDMVCR